MVYVLFYSLKQNKLEVQHRYNFFPPKQKTKNIIALDNVTKISSTLVDHKTNNQLTVTVVSLSVITVSIWKYPNNPIQ